MIFNEIIWLGPVEEKLVVKHQVQPYEAEDVLTGNPHVRFIERGHRAGEDLYAAFGGLRLGVISSYSLF